MKISLAELRLILINKENKLKELISTRLVCRFNIYKEKENKKILMHEPYDKNVEEIQNEIEQVEKEIRILTCVRDKANVSNYIDFEIDNEKLTIREALLYLSQLECGLEDIKKLSLLQSTSEIIDPNPYRSQNSIDRSYEQIKEPTFNTKYMKKKYEKNNKIISKLKLDINKANCNINVEIPDYFEIETSSYIE